MLLTIKLAKCNKTADSFWSVGPKYINVINDNMRQTEINNEIILLRKPVRQARICVISKLIREAKKLRAQRGNEKQLEKNKNKVDKLLREVYALKHIKDDEISKFGIINLENLQDILKNPRTDDGTRATVKIVRYKCLKEGISEFKEKFPDYKEYISWRKRRHSSKRKESRSVDDIPEENRKRARIDRNDGKKVSANKEGIKSKTHKSGSIERLQCTTRQQSKKITEQFNKLPVEESREKLEGNECKSTTKVISKEASVKRFAEVLEEANTKDITSEHEESNDRQFCNDAVKCRRRTADEFFLSSDEASSSVTTVLSTERNNERTFDRAFKSVRVKNEEEEKLSEDQRAVVVGRGKNGRKEKLDDNDISEDQQSGGTRRKTKITHSKQYKDISVKKISVKRNEANCTTYCKSKEEELHPSWVARKKQQEIMKQGFQGKKIKFEED